MSSFDDAMRAHENQQAHQRYWDEAKRQAVAAAGVEVERLLLDFLNYVSPRVQPLRYRLEPSAGIGQFLPARLPQYSPNGYALHNYSGGGHHSIDMITPDAQLWRYKGGKWQKNVEKRFIPLRAAINEGICIGNGQLGVEVDMQTPADGRPPGHFLCINYSHGDRSFDVAGALAALARNLITPGGA